jgi:hypothetical protein
MSEWATNQRMHYSWLSSILVRLECFVGNWSIFLKLIDQVRLGGFWWSVPCDRVILMGIRNGGA